MGILRSTCLTTDLQPGDIGHATRTTLGVNSVVHTLHDRLVVFLVDHRVVLLVIFHIERVLTLYMLDNVRDIVVATISHNSRKIGHLQWRAAQLTLTDSE